MPGHKRHTDAYAPGSPESAASHALSKADWIDLFADLYRQCFGETESTPPVIMADALRRAKLLNLPNAATAQRTHDRMLAKAYAATATATSATPPDERQRAMLVDFARRVITMTPDTMMSPEDADAARVICANFGLSAVSPAARSARILADAVIAHHAARTPFDRATLADAHASAARIVAHLTAPPAATA